MCSSFFLISTRNNSRIFCLQYAFWKTKIQSVSLREKKKLFWRKKGKAKAPSPDPGSKSTAHSRLVWSAAVVPLLGQELPCPMGRRTLEIGKATCHVPANTHRTQPAYENREKFDTIQVASVKKSCKIEESSEMGDQIQVGFPYQRL